VKRIVAALALTRSAGSSTQHYGVTRYRTQTSENRPLGRESARFPSDRHPCDFAGILLAKDKLEVRCSTDALATEVTAYAAECTKASTPRDASSAWMSPARNRRASSFCFSTASKCATVSPRTNKWDCSPVQSSAIGRISSCT